MAEPLLRGRAVAALARRGARTYLETPAAYIALLVFYFLTGAVFCAPVFLNGQATIQTLKDFEPLMLTFLVPALTMGLLADELRAGTFECLATLPLEDWDIVLGKYLGFAQLQAFAIGGLLFFPLVLSLLAQPPASLDWGQSLGVLLALLLQGLLLGAVGLFASSLGRSQVTAFVVAFLIGFAFFAAGKFAVFAPPAAAPVVEFLGLDSHIDALSRGIVDTRDLLYFATATFAFLYAAAARLQARRS